MSVWHYSVTTPLRRYCSEIVHGNLGPPLATVLVAAINNHRLHHVVHGSVKVALNCCRGGDNGPDVLDRRYGVTQIAGVPHQIKLCSECSPKKLNGAEVWGVGGAI